LLSCNTSSDLRLGALLPAWKKLYIVSRKSGVAR
jgi:hypothetical protein